jgi:DNA adenine methylase
MVGPLPYVGGKRNLAKQIIELLPAHTTFCEAFAGGAQVLFAKQPSKVEILNDLDGEVVNFFRIVKEHHEELLRYFRFMLVGRKWYDLLRATDPQTLTDVQRAARWFYVLKASFASRVSHPNYHWHVVQPPGLNPDRLPELFEKAHKRLARVQLECLPYEKILAHFDRKETLFFLDPPYFRKRLYRFNFQDGDFVTLEERLRGLRGKFLLSLNDVPEIRKLFSGYHVRQVQLHYTSQKSAGRRYPELLIANFPI